MAAHIDTVCHHLALVAIDGASDEVALTLAPSFRLHIDRSCTDRWGYLAMIEANHSAHGTRPPLDVMNARCTGDFVTVRLEPRCLATFKLVDDVIVDLWMTVDWNVWNDWVLDRSTT